MLLGLTLKVTYWTLFWLSFLLVRDFLAMVVPFTLKLKLHLILTGLRGT